jgi:hypothetical protein
VHDTAPIERAVPWVLRALWIMVLITGGRAVDAALTDAAATAATATRWVALAAWTVGVAAMAIPAPTTLTATRVLVPLTVPVAVLVSAGGAGTVDAALFTATALVATLVAFSSPLGRTFVLASAYGDEDRHLLRPPLAYLLVAGAAWLAWAATTVGAAAAIAHAAWPAVAALGALTVAGGWLGFTRWHRLSRRWIVLVPSGVVLHDHIVLAETLMLRREQLARLGLAPAGTDAADLTGPAPGHAVEIRTVEPVTALIGLSPGKAAGSAIHLTGCLVAPTRPGRLLAAASRRGLPVGHIDAAT